MDSEKRMYKVFQRNADGRAGMLTVYAVDDEGALIEARAATIDMYGTASGFTYEIVMSTR